MEEEIKVRRLLVEKNIKSDQNTDWPFQKMRNYFLDIYNYQYLMAFMFLISNLIK